MTIKKAVRSKVLDVFSGRCAYCGKEHKKLQVDHVFPLALKNKKEAPDDIDCIDNLMPACPRCNRYKTNMSLEQFRREIGYQVERARNYSWNFRMAEDYGLIQEMKRPVVFYFEKLKEIK